MTGNAETCNMSQDYFGLNRFRGIGTYNYNLSNTIITTIITTNNTPNNNDNTNSNNNNNTTNTTTTTNNSRYINNNNNKNKVYSLKQETFIKEKR